VTCRWRHHAGARRRRGSLEELLTRIHGPLPPIFVVQHMPVGFTGALARRLDGLTPFTVCEASDGELLRPDHIYIAPAGLQSEVRVSPTGAVMAHVRPGVRVSQHIPSVDVLFESVAKHVRRRSVGIVMTGMGSDGARGLRLMREAGALTVAQDEQSSVVYGMPRAAAESGAADHVIDVRGIAELLGSLRGLRPDSARAGPSAVPAQRS
jgi:two-component system, chemotaxis family, protein-glutamate methylesterase/glutaminase